MAVHPDYAVLTEQSVLYNQLQSAPTQVVGKFHPIDLPTTTIDKIKKTIGDKITQGNYGAIYQVNDCAPSRIYKIISEDQFRDGDEIRVSIIASNQMLGPTFYSASLIMQGSKNFVVIEMDDAGLSLGKWMEKLAGPVEEVKEMEPELTAKQKAIAQMMARLQAQDSSSFVVTEIKQIKKVSMEEAIEKLYPTREVFYFTLFSKIKVFAENNISYGDTHVGNIMPNQGLKKGMQLIDFDASTIHESIDQAVKKSMASSYNAILFREFSELPNLSKESKELIAWFLKRD